MEVSTVARTVILCFTFVTGFVYADNPFTEAARRKFSLTRLDHCFCEVNSPSPTGT